MANLSKRRFPTLSLHPGFADDYEADPCCSGILRNTSCRSHRNRLRKARNSRIFNGFMVLSVLAAIMTVLLLNKVETKAAGEGGDCKMDISFGLQETLMPLWLGVLKFVGSLVEAPIVNSTDMPAREYYCRQPLDTKRIFRGMRLQVLNQEHALERLERELRSDRQFKSVALIGPPGVGKTLTAIALRQHFPWPENVHSYSWSTYVADEANKFHMIRLFVDQLSDCGQNLLIIDNLATCDYSIVPIYNQLLLEREGDRNAAANQSVLVVYIFNLETEQYWEQIELLQELPAETAIVSYRPFGREEVIDCLNNELLLENRVLSPQAKVNILEEIDISNTGCKCLRRLIMQYSQPGIK